MRRSICAALCALAVLATASGSAAAITFTPSSTVATNLGRVRLSDGFNIAECDLVSTLHILSPISLPLSGVTLDGWVDGITFSNCANPIYTIQSITSLVLGGRTGSYGWPLDLTQILGTLGSSYSGGVFRMRFSVQLLVGSIVSCRLTADAVFLMERGYRKTYIGAPTPVAGSTCYSWAWNAPGAAFSPTLSIS